MIIRAIITLYLLTNFAFAQVSLTGAGLAKPNAVAAYSGPGDVVSGASAFWGLRAYNNAYAVAQKKLANICLPLDAVCADVNSDTNGNFNISAVGTLTCNNSTTICTVKTLYDQSGALACAGGTACDVTQATIGNRPTLVLAGAANGCTNIALPCMAFALASTQCLFTSVGYTQAQPLSLHMVAIRTGNLTTVQQGIGFSAVAQVMGWSSTAVVRITFGTPQTVAATDSAWHNIDGIASNSVGALSVDGATTTANNGTGAPSAAQIEIGSRSIACLQPLDGKMNETAIYPFAFNAGNFSGLNTNVHTYWNF